MKNLMVLIFAFVFSLPSYGFKIVNNGGDFRALEFVRIGHVIVDVLNRNPNKVGVRAGSLALALKSTVVESVDRPLFLNGIPKDAINTHVVGLIGGMITFNRAAWDSQISSRAKFIFVAHEYLGILGYDDSRYQISTQIANLENYFVSGDIALALLEVLSEAGVAWEKNDQDVSYMAPRIYCSRYLFNKKTAYSCEILSQKESSWLHPILLEEQPSRELFTLLRHLTPACPAHHCGIKILNLTCEGSFTSTLSQVCTATGISVYETPNVTLPDDFLR